MGKTDLSNIRRESELPDERVDGEPIDWVWVVYRPASNSDLRREELLGVYDNADAAESHARNASRVGRCAVKEMTLSDGTTVFNRD